jgi:subtilisin family serine protease
VVAVLDTGVGRHPWLDCSSQLSGDSFVLLDPQIQALMVAAQVTGGVPDPLYGTTEEPVYDSPLTGELDTHSGHGTFIAGIIRQAAPNARVRSIRIMHDDGIVYENDLILVLGTLLAQARYAAGAGGGPEFVDVISLSAGYYSENSDDVAYTSRLSSIIADLAGCGVLFVASAGNDSTTRPCYPAALPPDSNGDYVVLSVGALNPNGTSKAFFSNDGLWVRWWATGAAVISTFPTTYNGSAGASNFLIEANPANGPRLRETIDPDDFRSGFATWSGTSFAAPLVAAALADAVLAEAEADPAVSLNHVGPKYATTRAARAIRRVAG